MPIGVVGCLGILQGATYLYEFQFGKIQPRTQESAASTSSKDDHASEELVNQATNQGRRRRGKERCKAVVADLSSLEGEVREEKSQDGATGSVNVTAEARSYPGYVVEETGLTITAVKITNKHQVTSEGKDQPQRNLPQKEQGQNSETDASKTGGNKEETNKAHSDRGEDSVPATQKEEQPQKLTSHDDQSPTGKAGTTKEESKGKESIKPVAAECSQDSVPTTSSREQPKGAYIQKEEGPAFECISDEIGSIGGEPKKPTCDKATKTLSTALSKEQPKTTSAQKDQRTTSEDVARKIGCKGNEQESSKEDQGPTSVVIGGKIEETEKESGKPSLSDNAENSFQVTSSKEQTKQISGEEEGKPTSSGWSSDFGKTDCSAIASKKQVKKQSTQEDKVTACVEKVLQNPYFNNDTKTVLSTSFQEQSKKQLALQDPCETCEVVGNEKEPPRSSSDNAKKTNPTTPGEKQAQRELALNHLGPINQADADKKSKVDEPKPMGQGSYNDKALDVSTSSNKKESNSESDQKDQSLVCKLDDGTKEYFMLESKENERVGPSDENQEGPKKSASGKRYSLMRHPRNMENEMMGPSDENQEGPKKSESGKRYSLMRHPRNMKNEMLGPSDENQEGPKKSASGKRYSLMRHPRNMENGMMGPSDENQEGPKKVASGKRYSLMRHPRNMEAAKIGPSDEFQAAPKKSAGGKRYSLMRHPRNMGKPQPNPVATAEEAASSIPSEERFPTNTIKSSTSKVTIWANTPKPKIVTVPAQSEGKAPESLDEKSQKESKLVESVTERSLNVLVRQMTCIRRKKQDLCVRQKFSTVLSTIVEETLTELTNVATVGKETVVVSLQPSRGQPKINFPITQERDVKDPVGCDTKYSASSPSVVPRTETAVMQLRSNTSSGGRQTTPVECMYDPATHSALTAASPVQQGTNDTTPPDQSRSQKPVTVRHRQGASITKLPQMSTLSAAYNPYSATPIMQQQRNISPAGNCVSTPVVYVYPEQLAAYSLMAASPVQQGPTDNMPSDQLRVQTSVPVRHQQEVRTTELPQMTPSRAAYTTYSTALVMQQQGYIPLAVNLGSTPVLYMYPEQLADYLSKAASSVQIGPTDNMPTDQLRVQKSVPVRHQQEVRTTELPHMTPPSAAYSTYSTSLVMQQQGFNPLAVNLGSTPVLYMYPEQLAEYLSKAASPIQQGPTDNMPTDQSRMQKSVPVRHQQDELHGNTIADGSHQVETCVNGLPTLPSGNTSDQSDYHVPSLKNEMWYASIPSKVITTCTPSQQQGVVDPHIHKRYATVSLGVAPAHKTHPTVRTPGLKQDVQRTPRVTFPKVVSTLTTPKESAILSVNNCIPHATASHMKQHANITPSVQVLQKKYQVTSRKVLPVTYAPEKKASPIACKAPKAATPLNHQQSKTTLAVKEVVHKKDQVTFPRVVLTISTSQGEAQSLSIKAVVKINEQPKKTCHSQLQLCASSQAVRSKERGPLAKAQPSNTVETSTADQTESTAKAKISKSTKRRRAKARQRQRAAETVKRAAEAEKKEAPEEAAAAIMKETEGADSSNLGEVASSSSNEIILNFDDDSYYAIDWEAEAAKPFYNSTIIFPPRVPIPDWAEWDFSQNERLRQLGQENSFK